jgi:hypothetical protein
MGVVNCDGSLNLNSILKAYNTNAKSKPSSGGLDNCATLHTPQNRHRAKVGSESKRIKTNKVPDRKTMAPTEDLLDNLDF